MITYHRVKGEIVKRYNEEECGTKRKKLDVLKQSHSFDVQSHAHPSSLTLSSPAIEDINGAYQR